MIPGVELTDFILWGGVVAVAAVIFAESGLMIGFFLPGDTLIFTAGFLVSVGLLPVDIHSLAIILFLAAVTGDSVGYAFGRRVGPRVFNRPNSRVFKQENVQKAKAFYDKYGGKTIIMARFIPVVRTFAPIVAGVSRMNYRTFLTYNIVGALIWAVGMTYLGYFAGSYFHSIGMEVDQVLLPLIGLILLISVAPGIVHLMRNKKQRVAMWNGTKRQIRVLLRLK
jgi:membrane-associated protein